jgi:hypothetical protein
VKTNIQKTTILKPQGILWSLDDYAAKVNNFSYWTNNCFLEHKKESIIIKFSLSNTLVGLDLLFLRLNNGYGFVDPLKSLNLIINQKHFNIYGLAYFDILGLICKETFDKKESSISFRLEFLDLSDHRDLASVLIIGETRNELIEEARIKVLDQLL